jgi:hypothetical protein
MTTPMHLEIPRHAMLHLALLPGRAELVVKRWKNGERWSVVARYDGTPEEMRAQFDVELSRLEEDYQTYLDRRAARHAGGPEG